MSLDNIYSLLTQVSIVSAGIPLVICGIKHEALNTTLRALFIYLCICIAADVLSYYYRDQDDIQNCIRNIFTLLEGTILGFIYYLEFGGQNTRHLVVVSLALFFLIAARYFIFLSMGAKIDTVVSSVEAVILIAFSTVYLLKFLFTPEIKTLENYYFFWIVLSNLVYFGTALIFFMFSKFIKNAPNHISDFIWGMHDLINIFCYILFAVGIWKIQKK